MNDIQIRKVALGGYHRGDVEEMIRQTQDASQRQQEALLAAQEARDSLAEERDALLRDTAALREEGNEKTREIAALQTALNQKNRENTSLTHMLQEIQRSWEELTNELQTQKTALEEQRRLFDELLQEHSRLESKLERCNEVGRLAREGGGKAAQALTGVAAQLQEIRSQVREADAALDRDKRGVV